MLPLRVHTDLVEFTDEEGYGKYLDLHEVYDKFLNLRGVEVLFELDDMYSTHLSCYTCQQVRSGGHESLAHFHVALSLSIKAGPGTQPFI